MTMKIRKFTGKKVLILNRDSAVTLSFVRMIRDLGCEYKTAVNCLEAVALCSKAKKAEKPFNIVLSDAATVNGDACSTAQKLLALGRNVKLVFSPGASGGLSLSEWQKGAFSVTLPRPVSTEELARMLV